MSALVMRGVRKRYGRIAALDGLDFEVPRGTVCGLIGPNGAGKTTAFGIVGGFLVADAGEVSILGEGAFDSAKHVGRVTLLPQDCELNPHTPVRDLLAYFATLQGMTRTEAKKAADRALDLVALSDRAGSKIRQLSHGMRRRVAVAQAFLGEPELVLLDEPTNGLDPELVVRMRELFRSQRGKRTLVVSSHNLLELEAACDHVVFLEKGKCVRAGSLAEVTKRAAMVRIALESRIAFDAPAGTVIDWEGSTLVVTGDVASAADLNARVLPLLIAAGARIVEVRPGQSLEAVYLSRY